MFRLSLGSTLIVLMSNILQVIPSIQSQVSGDPVVILAVSTIKDQENSIPVGSVMGGTTLYMKVQGLDQYEGNNTVLIGGYPCLTTKYGIKGLSLSCITSKPNSGDPNLQNLKIVVLVKGKRDSVCTYSSTQCFFSYSVENTPELQYVVPRSNYPKSLSNWQAKWTISTTQEKDLKGLYIGTKRCDRVSIQNFSNTNINSTDDIVTCQLPPDIEAGYYKYNLYTSQGFQNNNQQLTQKKVYSNETYDSKIIPIITQLNTNYGSRNGQILIINGLGFSANPSENLISITNQKFIYGDKIKLLSSSPTQLTVQLPPSFDPYEQNAFKQQLPPAQENKLYISGSSLFYTKYDLTGLDQFSLNCDLFSQVLIDDPSQLNNRKLFDGIYPETELINTSDDNQLIGEYLHGFFKAPQAGDYTFCLESYDSVLFYMQTNISMNDTRPIQPILNSSLSSNENNKNTNIFSQYSFNQQISNSVTLQYNEYYFIEIFHITNKTKEKLTLSMVIENTNDTNSLSSIYTLTTSYSATKEIWQYMIYNTAENLLLEGTYQIQFSNTENQGIYYTSDLSLYTPVEVIKKAIENCGLNYLVTVTAIKLDLFGNIQNDDAAEYAGYQFNITFDSYRNQEIRFKPQLSLQLTGNENNSPHFICIQEPKEPIRLFFYMAIIFQSKLYPFKVNGDGSLPYDVTPSSLADNIENFTGIRPMVWSNGRAQDGWTWIIKFPVNFSELIQILTVSYLIADDYEQPVSLILKKYRSFEPIPNELLFTYGKQLSVLVESKGILASCSTKSACDFSISDSKTQTLTGVEVIGSLLTVTLVPGSEQSSINVEDLAVQYMGANCTNIQLSYSDPSYSLTCNLDQQDGINIQQGGFNQFPLIHVKNIGYALIDNTVQGVFLPIVIVSIYPNTIPPDGGTLVSMKGSGFPVNLQQNLSFSIGYAKVNNIIKLSPSEITFITPNNMDLNSPFIHLSINEYQGSFDFIFDYSKRMQIVSLQENPISPFYDGNYLIQGTNFGSSLTDITVLLKTENSTLNCNIQAVNDTSIQIYLSWLKPGNYEVVVNKKDYGDSYALSNINKIQSIIPVSSVKLMNGSLAVGSAAGGWTIVINVPLSINFLYLKAELLIGNIKVQCEDRQNGYKFTIPPLNIPQTDGPSQVQLLYNEQYLSSCIATNQADCNFYYNNSLTAKLDSYPQNSIQFFTEKSVIYKKAYFVNDIETLSGTGLTDQMQVIFIPIGMVTGSYEYLAQLNQNKFEITLKQNQLTYKIPNLTYGEYITYISTSSGIADKNWITIIQENKLKITNISPSQPALGGQYITIYGDGLILSDQNPISIMIGSSPCINITDSDPHEIVESDKGKILFCKMEMQTQQSTPLSISISQFPLTNNSGIPKTETYQLTILSKDQSPSLTNITVNDTDTYNEDLKANIFLLDYFGEFTLEINGSKLQQQIYLDVFLLDENNHKISGYIRSQEDDFVLVVFQDVPAGKYLINVCIDGALAYIDDQTRLSLIIQTQATISNQVITFAGGNTVSFLGGGLYSAKPSVIICGFECSILQVFYYKLDCLTPQLQTEQLINQFPFLRKEPSYILLSNFILSADQIVNVKNPFDDVQDTFYVSSSSQCYIQMDLESNLTLNLHHFQFMPRIDFSPSLLAGATFQYSLDKNSWNKLFVIDNNTQTGWNYYLPENDISGVKSIRLFDDRGSKGSLCQIAEIKIKGQIFSSSVLNENGEIECDAIVNGIKQLPVSNAVTYSNDATPIVQTVEPQIGTIAGATKITITGIGFIQDQTTVQIDNRGCSIISVTETQIQCVTAQKELIDFIHLIQPANGLFEVRVNGNLAINYQIFRYILQWSDIIQWQKNSVFYFEQAIAYHHDQLIIEKGWTFLIDQQIPKLDRLTIRGTVILSDELDLQIDVNSIVIEQGGQFLIGNKTHPHQHKVVVTLYGDTDNNRIQNNQNLAFICNQCQLIIHGQERKPIWTLLSNTVDIGATNIVVDDIVDWKVGEQIVIASSSYDPEESEIRIIKNVNIDQKTITLDQPLKYKHYSEQLTIGNNKFQKKTEVGLLTRNIIIQGQESDNKIGYHLFINGRNELDTQVLISYTEFKYGGQQGTDNRYPINFNLNSIADNSYIIGNSIHNNYARCITIQGTQYLKIQNNICYNTYGHGIALDSGTEIKNIIEANLVINTKKTWELQNSDITVASFWISNPYNSIKGNRAVGSEWNGFSFDLNPYAEGSLANNICPSTMNISEFNNNTAHSNLNIGLEIIQLSPRMAPCNYSDSYEINPTVLAVFNNYQTWYNSQNGIFMYDVDGIILKNITISDTKFTNIYYHTTNQSALPKYVLQDILIIVQPDEYSKLVDYYNQSFSINTTLGLAMENIKISDLNNLAIIQAFNTTSNNNNNQTDSSQNNTSANNTNVQYNSTTTTETCTNQTNTLDNTTNSSTNTTNTTDTSTNTTNISTNTTNSSTNTTNTTDSSTNTTNISTNTTNSSTNTTNTTDSSTNTTNISTNTTNSSTNTTNTTDSSTNTTNTSDNTTTNTSTNSTNSSTNTTNSSTNTTNSQTNATNSSNTNNDSVTNIDGYYFWSKAENWDGNKVPVEEDNVTISANQKILLDIDPPQLQNLIIEGVLKFDQRKTQTTLKVGQILITSGKLEAGNLTNPYKSKISVILNGQNDNGAKNSIINVTNAIELYSSYGTSWTRLTNFADQGTSQIQVSECLNWQIGDQIVLGPSGSDPEQKEKKTIQAISGCQITIDSPLSHPHYGSPQITIQKNGIGSLDMRSVVVHLTRNIVIKGNSLRCQVSIQNKGYAILHGLEFENCGIDNPDYGGLDFSDLTQSDDQIKNEVIGCSFHDSKGIQLNIKNSQKITVYNNVFFQGVKALVQINNSQNIIFQNNALVYVQKSTTIVTNTTNWAVLGNFIYINETQPTRMTRDIVDISGNVGQGSQDTGFFIMSSNCSDSSESSFYNNECSGSILSCFAIRQSNGSCDYVQGLSAYHSGVGIMYAVNSLLIKLEYSLSAENQIGIVLRKGSDSIQDNVIEFSNSYVTAFARPDCAQCYSQQLNPQCHQTNGVKMGTVSSIAFPPIAFKPSDQYDIITTIQRVDLRVYINKVEFNGFKLSYEQAQLCQNNAVFRTNEKAFDMTGQHYLVNSPCSDCDQNSILYQMRDPDMSRLGSAGGCGSFECTGQRNVLIEDQTGEFFGQIGQAISNNKYIGPNLTECTRNDYWNGYWCPKQILTLLNFMSVAPDFNKRLYSPVYLKTGNVTNKINSFMEWNWYGNTPLNTRESKFVSLVKVNSIIIMNNTGENPTSSEYWLTKKNQNENSSDYVIIQWQFKVPQVVSITVNNTVIQPGITATGDHYDLNAMTNQCGANNFFYENKTIHFVVNGQLGCKAKVSLKNTLQVTTKLQAKKSTFSPIKFLTYAVQKLGGNPQNYKILRITTHKKRLLTEEDEDIIVDIDWGIVDDAEIGTQASQQSATNLNILASSLESFIPPTDIGKVLEQSSTIAAISTLNYPSSEEIPTSNNNNQIVVDSNSGDNINQDNNSNISTNNETNFNSSDDDNIILTLNEVVNDQETINNSGSGNQTQNNSEIINNQSTSPSTTVIIIVSVICPVVGISLIIMGFLYFRKWKLVKDTQLKAQKYQFDTIKIDAIDPQIPMKVTQQQSVQ